MAELTGRELVARVLRQAGVEHGGNIKPIPGYAAALGSIATEVL